MRVVVIGGDAAGMTAAAGIKRKLRANVDVTVIERQVWTSYSACGIPYWIAGLIADPEPLIMRSPEKHRSNGLDVRTATEAIEIDPVGRRVLARALGSGDRSEHPYDELVIGTGAVPLEPDIPGVDLPGVLRAQNLADGFAAVEALEDRPERAVIIGSGFIGLELAEACVDRGIHTTVVDLAPEPLTTLDPDMGARVRRAMEREGVVVRMLEPAEAITGDGRAEAVVTPAGEYAADIVFLGLGVQPRTELAVAAGLPVGAARGLLIDDHCRVVEGIWAGGDCVEVRDRITGEYRHVPLGTHANHHGRVIAENISGRPATWPGMIGTSITRFRQTEIARTGLRESEATEHGFTVDAATIEASTKSGYFPGSERMAVKIIAERATGRVLGGQIVGGTGAGKRIDTLATAITAGMTVLDVVNLDLAYAPPFSPTWDPVQTAARQLL